MAIIGNFIYDPSTDTYTGEIITLTLYRCNVSLCPVNKSHEREPDYRVVQGQETAAVDLGAGWKRSSERGREFVSIMLDDPALSSPINVAMFLAGEGNKATLVWQRPQKKAPPAEPEQTKSAPRRTRAPLRPIPA